MNSLDNFLEPSPLENTFFFSFEKSDMANGETYLCHHDKDEREENECSLTLDHHRSRFGAVLVSDNDSSGKGHV
jgi:hypothetical protein